MNSVGVNNNSFLFTKIVATLGPASASVQGDEKTDRVGCQGFQDQLFSRYI